MATAKKTAGKKAGKSPSDQHPGLAPALKRDANFPEVHPDRHAKSGLQEAPTAGGAPSGDKSEAGAGGAGILQAKTAPNPSVGTRHDESDTTGPAVNTPQEGAKHVYSLEQALLLPVVDKGTPVKMPTDAQLEKDRKDRSEKESAAAKRRNERKPAGDTTPDEDEDVQLPLRRPVISFKDADRRTMLVVSGKDGLGAMPAKDFVDAAAPNA